MTAFNGRIARVMRVKYQVVDTRQLEWRGANHPGPWEKMLDVARNVRRIDRRACVSTIKVVRALVAEQLSRAIQIG